MKIFPGCKPMDPRFCSLCSHLVSAPANIQPRLGTNKILSNRVKLTSARASETKSVWVFVCSIYRLSNETVVYTSFCYLRLTPAMPLFTGHHSILQCKDLYHSSNIFSQKTPLVSTKRRQNLKITITKEALFLFSTEINRTAITTSS